MLNTFNGKQTKKMNNDYIKTQLELLKQLREEFMVEITDKGLDIKWTDKGESIKKQMLLNYESQTITKKH